MNNIIQILKSITQTPHNKKGDYEEYFNEISAIANFSKSISKVSEILPVNPEQIIQIHSMMNFWFWMKNCSFESFQAMINEIYGEESSIGDEIFNIYMNRADYNLFDAFSYFDTHIRGEIAAYIIKKYEGVSIDKIQTSYLPKPSNTAL